MVMDKQCSKCEGEGGWLNIDATWTVCPVCGGSGISEDDDGVQEDSDEDD
jgi:DnaJ-class molecular chaperone